MSRVAKIPVPVKGWSTLQAVDDMQPEFAVEIVNFFPTPKGLQLRAGYLLHADSGARGAIQTLVEYFTTAGTKKLIASGNGCLYDVSSFGVTPTTLGSGYANNRWQSVTYKGTLILVNGSDQPKQYTTGSGLTDATYTGVSDDANLIQPSVYNERLYFVEKNSTSIWYGAAGSITGALTELDIGRQVRRGGNITWAGSFTRDTGTGVTDLFVVVMSTGEVVIFQGSYPGGSDWARVGRQYLSAPLGVRSVGNVGSDLIIVTESGIERESLLFSDALGAGQVAGTTKSTVQINEAFQDAAASAKLNWGWEICVFPSGPFALVNIPIAENSQSEQYVMHLQTGAWCRFVDINAACWCVYDSNLYFGGVDGRVYRYSGNADARPDTSSSASISAYFRTAFNYIKADNQQKAVSLAQIVMRTDSAAAALAVGLDFDFVQDSEFETTATIEGTGGSYWDVAVWDSSPWEGAPDTISDWQSVYGMGRAVSIHAGGNFRDIDLTISGLSLMYQDAGRI